LYTQPVQNNAASSWSRAPDGVRVRRTKAGSQVRNVAFSRSLYAVLLRPSSTWVVCMIASARIMLP